MSERLVAFDLRSAEGRPTGVGKHLLSIATAACQSPGVAVRAYLSGGAVQLPPGVEAVVIRRHGLRWHLAVWQHLRRHPVTAYVSTSLVVPSLPGVRALVAVLDVSSFRVPQHQTLRTKLFERTLMGRVIGRHPLIFGSEAAAADIRDLFPRAMGVVVPPWFPTRKSTPPPEKEWLASIGVTGRYMLMVGTIEPRKNALLAATAVARLRQRGRDFQLVLVGRRGWSNRKEIATLSKMAQEGVVVWPGYVTDPHRDALYAGASALLLPSAYEGFGMPLVEAMAAGVPCLCSAIPVFEEVAGDAAVRLDPTNVDEWVNALDALLSDQALSDRLRNAGIVIAATYSLDRTARAFALALDQRT